MTVSLKQEKPFSLCLTQFIYVYVFTYILSSQNMVLPYSLFAFFSLAK